MVVSASDRAASGEGQAGVVVDGDMQGQAAGMAGVAAPPAIAAQGDLLKAGHALDVQVQQIAGPGMLVALHRGGGDADRASD